MVSDQAAAVAVATKPPGLKRTALQVAAALVFSTYSLRYAYVETSQLLASQPESSYAKSWAADEIVDPKLLLDSWVDSHPTHLRGRTLSVIEGGNLSVLRQTNNSRCHIKTEVRLSKEIISPTYLASFHGGGTEITSHLVQSLTGIATTNQVNYAKRRAEHSVLVETHYPRHGSLVIENDSNYRGTILLLRNPIDAILSSFNIFYTQQYHLPSTIRAPIDDWIRYRDSAQFSAQVKLYSRFVITWMKKYRDNRDDLLLVPYEGLTGGKGAIFAKQIANFLSHDGKEGKGVNVVDPSSIPCVWEKVVKDQWFSQGQDSAPATPSTSFQERTDDRPFTQEQLRVVSRMLEGLAERFGHDKQLSNIMNSYINRISGSLTEIA